jgi:integrase
MVRVPANVRAPGEPAVVYRTMVTTDRRAAKLEADAWEVMLRAEWASRAVDEKPNTGVLRSLYEALRTEAGRGEFRVNGSAALGISHEIEKIEDAAEGRDLSVAEEIRLVALNDAAQALRGQPVAPRRELEPTIAETAADFVKLWAAKHGLKETNTRQQKEATFRLFAGYFGERPIRDVRQEDAALFVDALRGMDGRWARSPAAREMTWPELQKRYGGQGKGLSDATVNRHVMAMQELWKWAEQRGRCEGHNPFQGHRRKLRQGVNVQGYLPWEMDELSKLFNPPPRRADLTEVMVVGLFTGMRLDEIASLRHRQLRIAEGVAYIQIEDAKSPAGIRQVPLHPRLSWLAERGKAGDPDGRMWPAFNPEGPGKKPGADAGRDFSRFKAGKGFMTRRKAFHSFRKNVTQIMERAGVPENEWAQVFGHERGFTYSRYSPHGITLARRAEIIGLIEYPGVNLPDPPN